jgi:hypothetical protein
MACDRKGLLAARASLVAVAIGIGITGCTVETTAPPAPVNGEVVIDWQIDEGTDPATCQQASVDAIQVTVDTQGGQSAGTYSQSCTAFSTSIALAPGAYAATAVLVDGAGGVRTTSIPIDPFTLRGNDHLHIPIDFPASSFR